MKNTSPIVPDNPFLFLGEAPWGPKFRTRMTLFALVLKIGQGFRELLEMCFSCFITILRIGKDFRELSEML